ncbi:hypothetical protein A0128_04630 [Leptospira tipperaryensis]|uniref:HTH araC/xylS-type domain-containing protein n=1 Tax=Leptospira tipperaryensis TaxID=2564040 RepID=A0A1D7UUB9_9LEPT|nr:AraC family transcriptional regulator [Leptospira tipperaryensis]AOP33202.1 hypothetical protein A0128_04630 [Leptospira tipperaryensis]
MTDFSKSLLYLWDNKGLFTGRLPDIDLHTHAVHALCIGIDGEFEHSENGSKWIRCRSAMAPPGAPSAIRFSGTYSAILFYEPDSSEIQDFIYENSVPQKNKVSLHLKEEIKLLETIENLISIEDENQITERLEMIRVILNRKTETELRDQRLLQVIRMILSNPDENFSIEELSEKIGLSPSRLAHLFKEEVGIPIRFFRTWFRLKAAILFIKNGSSVTEAAVNAGFYDSSHFSNTFRKMFGFSPTDMFDPNRKIRWYIKNEEEFQKMLALRFV